MIDEIGVAAARARTRLPRTGLARLTGLSLGLAALLGAPAVVTAHNLSAVYQSPLPLAVYLAGAATTVALSFVFVLARDMRAAPTPEGRVVHVPAPIRIVLRVLGLVGWAWILVQGTAGGTSEASVASLFLWVYGWVGVAMLSALVAPVWEWVDPFATIHDMLAWGLRKLGIQGWAITDLPAAVRVWPAVVGLMFFIWLELVAVAGTGTLTVVLAGYTVLTLALMAQFGRDQWRAQGETFTVWFRTLNRLAVYGVAPAAKTAEARGVDPDDEDPDAVDAAAVIRRPFASGLLDAGLGDPARRPGRHRHRVDHLRRPVADGCLRHGLRQPGARPEDRDPDRVPVGHRRRGARRRTGRDLGRHRRGPDADRRRLPRRPLPHLPARSTASGSSSRSPTRSRTAADLFGTAFFLPATRSCHPGSSGPCSSRRWSAATCSARGRVTCGPSRTWRRSPRRSRRVTCATARSAHPAGGSRTSGAARCRWRS